MHGYVEEKRMYCYTFRSLDDLVVVQLDPDGYTEVDESEIWRYIYSIIEEREEDGLRPWEAYRDFILCPRKGWEEFILPQLKQLGVKILSTATPTPGYFGSGWTGLAIVEHPTGRVLVLVDGS